MTTDYFVEPHFGGGVERVVAEVSKRLVARGHELSVMTLARLSETGTSDYEGVRVDRVAGLRLNRLIGLEVRLPLVRPSRIEQLIRRHRPDVINAHHPLFRTTPMVLSVARRLGIPVVLTLHIGDLDLLPGLKGAAVRMYARRATRRALDEATATIAVSHAVAEEHGASAVVVPNGVDLERFHPGEQFRSAAPQRLLFVGRLIVNKGPDLMLSAFEAIVDTRSDVLLSFVGDGPMKAMLEKRVRAHGLENRVRFLGLRTDVDVLMRESDVLIRPSLVEGMPLTVLEGMATGLPVVASDVAGVREVVAHGESGILVPPGSSEALTREVLRLLSDRGLRERLGKAGREAALRYTWERTAAQTEGVLIEAATS